MAIVNMLGKEQFDKATKDIIQLPKDKRIKEFRFGLSALEFDYDAFSGRKSGYQLRIDNAILKLQNNQSKLQTIYVLNYAKMDKVNDKIKICLKRMKLLKGLIKKARNSND